MISGKFKRFKSEVRENEDFGYLVNPIEWQLRMLEQCFLRVDFGKVYGKSVAGGIAGPQVKGGHVVSVF